MIKIKTAENTMTDIAEVHVKTAANALTKIAEGYQVVSVNGAKRLIPVFLSACKHNWEKIGFMGGDCTNEGYEEYKCTKCGETYTVNLGTDQTAHSYDSETGHCVLCKDPCGHFSASLEALEKYWVDESGCCKYCGYRVSA